MEYDWSWMKLVNECVVEMKSRWGKVNIDCGDGIGFEVLGIGRSNCERFWYFSEI